MLGRARVMFLCAAILGACGNGGADPADAAVADGAPPPDAGPPDACPNSLCSGTCCASAARNCGDGDAADCGCPDLVIEDPLNTLLEQMDPVRLAPLVLGLGVVPSDGGIGVVVVGFHPTDTPVDVDLDLAAPAEVSFVGFGYDADVASETTRASYTSSSGTLRLTRRCPEGVAGTMTAVTLLENLTAEDDTPHPHGCSFTIPALTFDIGPACP